MSKVIAGQTQQTQPEELLLLNLFMELRKQGLNLGIDEYKILQKAFQGGFGIADRDSLKRLCKALWVKSSEDERIFDSLFEKFLPTSKTESSTSSVENKSSSSSTKSQTPQATNDSKPKEPTAQSVDDKSEQAQSSSNNTTPEPIDSNFDQPSSPTSNADDSFNQTTSGGNEAESSSTHDTADTTDSPELTWSPFDMESTLGIEDVKEEREVKLSSMESFVLTGEYFPVTKRQMKQSWRYLKRPLREGLPVELDLEATVKKIGQQGIFFDLVFVPPRVNKSELFLLVDRDGSMVPFHLLSHQLAQTLLRGGRLGKAGVYYFQNCPIEYLYRDCYRVQAELIEKFLGSLSTEYSSVLIFSDAGAARGRYREGRFKLTEEFLKKLKTKVRYVAWLNPIPEELWEDTTAEQINKIVPMFEFSLQGLQDAIGVLKGQPTSFEGRKV